MQQAILLNQILHIGGITCMAKFELPALPYPANALEPHIDAQTMEIHHGRHHATYVNNLNAALEGHSALAEKSLEDLFAQPQRGAGIDPHRGSQQRRRPRQPHPLLGNHEPQRRRSTDRGAGRRDQSKPSAASKSSRRNSPRRPSPVSAAAGPGWL